MLTIFGRKKLTTEQTAKLFSHHIVEVTEAGFPDVAGFINDSPEFIADPNIQPDDFGKFLMVVIAGNFSNLSSYFEDGQDKEIIAESKHHLASVFDMTPEAFSNTLKEYKDCMARANFPSKNVVSAMCKGVFMKYDLTNFQDDYFRSMKTPNPIFLKNFGDVMKNFLMDWDAFNEKYKVLGNQG